MNKVFLIGNLTKDPEVTTVGNDLANCKFSIAVSRRFGKNETDYFSVVCWRGMAENCGKYLRKGSKVGISGSIQTRNYEASDGTKRYTVEIVADEVQFLSTRNDSDNVDMIEGSNSSTKSVVRPSDLKPIEDGDDDMPF